MHPKREDKQALYALYKETFAFDDDGSIDHYFKHHYHEETCYIHRIQADITTMLCAHMHQMHWQEISLPVMFISGVITKESYRHQGYMNKVFQALFQETQDHIALYVLQAYDPHIYTALGFSPRYFTKTMTYANTGMPDHLVPVTSAKACATCAKIALRSFNGFMDHDQVFYEDQLLEAQAQNQLILGCYEDGYLTAFARIKQNKKALAIEEYCAIDEIHKTRLFQQLAAKTNTLTYPVPTTQDDPNAIVNLMVRMGNAQLCSAYFHKEIHTLDDIYHKDQSYYHYGWW